MLKKHVIGGLALLLVLGLTACAKLPQEQVTAAQSAMDSANAAEASTYAADELSKAQASMDQANAEIKAQESKFFKSYKKANEMLAQAKADADAAAAAAAAGKEQVKQEADAAMTAAQSALDAAEQAVAGAPKSKDRKADIEAMQSDVETLKGVLAEAHTAFDGGDYNGAKQKAEQVSNEAASIQNDIAQAGTKTGA